MKILKSIFSVIPLLTLILVFSNCSSDDDADIMPPVHEPKVFVGDVILSSQDEVDAFGLENYNEIDGSVFIGVNDPNAPVQSTNISSLNALNSINSIHYGLTIYNNPSLSNLEGLNNLLYINGGSLVIDSNQNLVTTNAMSRLASFKSLLVDNNATLLNLDGLNNVTLVRESVIISNNPELENINGLSGIRSIDGEYLFISDNDALTTLNGLNSLVMVLGNISISYNDGLTNLNSFSNLQAVGLNFSIVYNTQLSDFCGLDNFLRNGTIGANFSLFENAYNPSASDILAGDCSL